jgi:pyrroloquinoline-quinone synthase
LDSWIQLGTACGINLNTTTENEQTKEAINVFLDWCNNTDWKIIVASSLSQLNAVKNHQNKLNTWYELYPWIEPDGLRYFLLRLTQVSIDSEESLKFIENEHLNEQELRLATTVKRKLMTSILDSLVKD